MYYPASILPREQTTPTVQRIPELSPLDQCIPSSILTRENMTATQRTQHLQNWMLAGPDGAALSSLPAVLWLK